MSALRLAPADLAERWRASSFVERDRTVVYGLDSAPGETVPDYAARITKFDPKLSLAGARSLDRIFRAAYEAVVGA